ncbi:MFS transporter [Streptomyces sp. NPDC088341]|uniref:MFS transporter n=1 Tax=Streptomyces sp. NPDC088341 TaxID=3154870 RepID=UPI00342F35CD
MQPNSPWRIADFRALFTSAALSQLGTNVSYVAVPLIAVSALDASPGQVGALAALSTVAFLLIGLPAGAWVDRVRHRRVLIVADLTRALLLRAAVSSPCSPRRWPCSSPPCPTSATPAARWACSGRGRSGPAAWRPLHPAHRRPARIRPHPR